MPTLPCICRSSRDRITRIAARIRALLLPLVTALPRLLRSYGEEGDEWQAKECRACPDSRLGMQTQPRLQMIHCATIGIGISLVYLLGLSPSAFRTITAILSAFYVGVARILHILQIR